MNEKFLSREQIVEIQNSVDIVDIISSYLPLTTKGKNYFGVCPFHSDHSPSMSVSREKQIYKCFACGASGNVLSFIMDYENISFYDAIKKLADKAGININLGTKKKSIDDKNKVLYDIFDVAQKLYTNNINTETGKNARDYIIKRHFDSSIIKEFGLGLSLSSYDQLTNILIKKNFKMDDMVRTGLVNKGEKGYKDIYLNRIMFPLYDLTGKIVGYSGRIYNGESTSKYINTKETEIFKKGELLYNYHKAKDIAKEKGQVIIVEGFFALIRLHTIGVDNVIATLGTALTKKQALIIKRMAKEVIVCFDGDNAGAEATNSTTKLFNEIGIVPKIIRLEDKLDPDDYILKYGKDRMLDKINNPMSLLDYKLNYHKANKNLQNDLDMSNYINEMIDEINKIDDDVYRELSIKRLSDESKLSTEFIREKLNNKEKPIIQETIKPKTIKMNKYDKAETYLIYYMLNDKDTVKKFERERPFIENNEYRLLSKELVYFLKNHGKISIAELLTYYIDDKEMLNIINKLNSLNIKDDFKSEEIDDYIKLLKERSINKEIADLAKKMREETDISKKALLSQKIIELKRENVVVE